MSWCILVNTTPNYINMARVQITCLRRYAKGLDSIPIFLATELTAENSSVKQILELPNVTMLRLKGEEVDFLESRVAAFEYLHEFKYILPLQDDFWLDREPNYTLLEEAHDIMEKDSRVKSMRLMPCPGPDADDLEYLPNLYKGRWKLLSEKDTLVFIFQATLWRRQEYIDFLKERIQSGKLQYSEYSYGLSWSQYCIKKNICENQDGQNMFKQTFLNSESLHLSIERYGKHPNAVFLAPFPYRPTAVVRGILEPWAREFMQREGLK